MRLISLVVFIFSSFFVYSASAFELSQTFTNTYSEYRSNKALSSLIAKEKIKIFNTIDEYAVAYKLNKKVAYYNHYVNLFNDEESVETGGMGSECMSPNKVGAIVVNADKEYGETGPIAVRKAFKIGSDLPQDMEIKKAFYEKYAGKNKFGPIKIKHDNKYLRLDVSIDYIDYNNGTKIVSYLIIDDTAAIKSYLVNKNKAKKMF